ncbi:MAG: tetratricopeptide repeat protein [Candidatus Lindowbacteria bacterium]|nr:tetratricopeptide repeat protein [Candidatus Lindowbacteria bacterium]
MNCKTAQSLMLDYLYGELEPRNKEGLKKHLQECLKCADELAAHRATVAAFKQLRMEEPPAEMAEKLAAKAVEEVDRMGVVRAPHVWYWRPALAAAMVVAVLAVAIIYYLPSGSRHGQIAEDLIALKQPERVPAEPRAFSFSEPVTPGKDMAGFRDDRNMPEAAPRDKGVAAKADGFGCASLNGADTGAKAELFKERSESEGFSPDSDIQQQLALDKKAIEEYQRGERDESASRTLAPPAEPVEPPKTGRLSAQGGFSEVASAPAPAQADGAKEADSVKLSVAPEKPKQSLIEDEEANEKADSAARFSELGAIAERKQQTAQDVLARGNAYFDARDFQRAATSYEDFIARKPEDKLTPQAMRKLGQSYQELGDCEKAVDAYSEIMEKYPGFPDTGDVLMAAGDCYLELGRTEDAVRVFEIAAEKFPALRDVARRKIEEVKEKTAR